MTQSEQTGGGEDAELLSAFLAERDVACPRCGYNLRGLRGSACPECGDALKLLVGLVERRLAAFILLLVAVCLGLGGSTLFGFIALAAGAPRSWWSDTSARLLLVQWLLTGLLLPVVLIARRRVRRLPQRFQWLLAGAVALVVFGLSIGIIITFED